MNNNNLKHQILNDILPYVQKPGRYIGMEINSITKYPSEADVKMALAFPDVYEIGMSHYGFKILYDLINKNEHFCAERTYAPWPDMEKMLREKSLPLYTLENFTPVSEFDVIGFSLQYELSYTNVLNMLDLGGIPVFAKDRANGGWPIIAGGGPCALNPEPLADFFDLFFIGEAEETLMQFLDLIRASKGTPKEKILKTTAETIEGIYVPSLAVAASSNVKKSIVKDLNAIPSPTKQLVPLIGIIHDRAALEIMRGCAKGCRFCHAGSIYRPQRCRKKEVLIKEAQEVIKNTGYQELSLLSLSTGDHPEIEQLIDGLVEIFDKQKVSISIPSLRVDSFSVEIAKKIKKIKKTGFTFACEAGSERLLEVIRKDISFDELYSAVQSAYRSGWNLIKLYFMIGLPGETFDDIDKIADIIYKVSDLKRAVDGKPGNVNVTISSFVPKPHTPFQWVSMDSIDEIRKKQVHLKKKINGKRFSVKFHDADKNFVEAVFSRGDKKLSAVIFEAWKNGARFDDWQEYFNLGTWKNAFQKCGIDPAQYTQEIPTDSQLPWDFIDIGIRKEALLNEYKKALEAIKQW